MGVATPLASSTKSFALRLRIRRRPARTVLYLPPEMNSTKRFLVLLLRQPSCQPVQVILCLCSWVTPRPLPTQWPLTVGGGGNCVFPDSTLADELCPQNFLTTFSSVGDP